MKIMKVIIFSVIMTVAFALNAQNLVTAPASVYLDTPPGVKCLQDKENNIQKLLLEKYAQDKEGNLRIGATLYYGTVEGDKYPGRGIAAETETSYKISFEYRGTVPRFWTGADEQTGETFWKGRKRLKTTHLIPQAEEWKKAEFAAKTSANSKRLSFFVNIYVNEKDKLFDVKPGQFLEVRNVTIEKN